MKKYLIIMKKYLVVCLITLLCSLSVNARNLGELRDIIRHDVLDTSGDTNRQRWTDAYVNLLINQAHDDLIKNTDCLQKTTYYTTYISTKSYPLPTDFLSPERVSIWTSTNVYRVIRRYSLFGLDNWNPYWLQLGNGLPEKYWIFGNKIGLVPPCSSTYAGDTKLKIQYIAKTSSMTADSNIPFNGYEHLKSYHMAIVYKVSEWLKTEERCYDEAAVYENKYDKMVIRMQKELDMTTNPDFKAAANFTMP